MDLSEQGVRLFCQANAARYGMSAEDMLRKPLMDIASCYMWNERRRMFYSVKDALSGPSQGPILVVADKADFLNKSHCECYILPGEHLSEILECRSELTTTFYSDGKDIRSESLTEYGADHYLYRVVTNLHGFHDFIAALEKGEAFTESELNIHTVSLLTSVSKALGWPDEKTSLQDKISNAKNKSENTENKRFCHECAPER